MKRKNNRGYIVLIICSFLQSCAYGPHIVEVPLMTRKNDAMVSVGISFPTARIPAISLSAAYAPTDNRHTGTRRIFTKE